MVTISKGANPNYLAKIVELKGLRKHTNADRLQIVSIDFQDVVTGMDAKDGDIYVYFPVECTINKDFLSHTNSFREKTLNKDSEKVGFFEDNCRVKAVRLRGEKSCGYIVPVDIVEEFTGISIRTFVGEEFDTIGDILMCKKFIPKNTRQEGSGKDKQGKKPKESRLVEGQVHLHIDTHNLRKNIHKIDPTDLVSITYKTHGTSGWCSNVLTKRKLSWWEKVCKFFGAKVEEVEYSLVYGSRKVVKNADMGSGEKNHFYKTDIWKAVVDYYNLEETLPKGFSLYYEILGYTPEGGEIQKGYDYGCELGQCRVEIYRITYTNPDGLVTEIANPFSIREFCAKLNMNTSYLFYYGYAGDMYPEIVSDEAWQENFLKRLEADFNEKDCFMCTNKVPEEGIVVRRDESLFECDSYKLKSFEFLGMESKQLDSGEVSMEDAN